MERLMTVDEVAEYLRLNREVVLRKVRKGEIPAVKVGTRTYRFYREQIDEWLKSKTITEAKELGATLSKTKKLELPSYPLGVKEILGRKGYSSVITKADKEQQLLALKKAKELRAKIGNRVGKPLPNSAGEIRALREERARRVF